MQVAKSPCILVIDLTLSDKARQYYYDLVDSLSSIFGKRNIVAVESGNRRSTRRMKTVCGIVLSGSPMRITETVDIKQVQIAIQYMLNYPNVPVLGICFGCQLLNVLYGGTVKPFGRLVHERVVYEGVGYGTGSGSGTVEGVCRVQCAFNDQLEVVAPGFKELGWLTVDAKHIVCHIRKGHIEGTLFHPEAGAVSGRCDGRFLHDFIGRVNEHIKKYSLKTNGNPN